MAVVSAIAAVAGAATGAIGAYQQSQAAKAQANYQRQVAENNATIAQQNATRIRQQAGVAEEEQRERLLATKGAARARLAANGLLVDDPGDTTASLFLQDIAEIGEYDILKMRDNYEQEARVAEIQGVNYQAQAGLFGLQASAQSPGFAAVGSLLSSAGKVTKAFKDIPSSPSTGMTRTGYTSGIVGGGGRMIGGV
jgi:hypothetical protein